MLKLYSIRKFKVSVRMVFGDTFQNLINKNYNELEFPVSFK